MKKAILSLLVFSFGLFPIFGQASKAKSPFSKLGYEKQVMFTSSKGEFEEFHNNADIVEIGSVYFNTKTNEVVGFVDEKKEKTEVTSATSAMSIDPLCEKYYWISPYAYCMDNPVRFIDLDGRDITIHYTDDKNKEQTWVFNGKNQSEAPKNSFIADFLIAYDYNIANGGGENLQRAATDNDIHANLREAIGIEKPYSSFNKKNGQYTETVWDSKLAVKTKDGYTMSPATVLEHEFAHTVDNITNPKEHQKRSNDKNSPYGDKEEERVAKIEATQAQKNGEFPVGYIRSDHSSSTFLRVNTPITNATLQQKPILFLLKNFWKYNY